MLARSPMIPTLPRELWFLCDLITSLGLHQENLFLQPGLRSEIGQLREWLDTGLPVNHPNVSIHSAAETLLLFTGMWHFLGIFDLFLKNLFEPKKAFVCCKIEFFK